MNDPKISKEYKHAELHEQVEGDGVLFCLTIRRGRDFFLHSLLSLKSTAKKGPLKH